MPDTIRTSRGCVRPWLGGLLAAIAVVSSPPAYADKQPSLVLHELVAGASRSIDRHEVAALVLIVGLSLFAVVTAMLLVHTRARSARAEASWHDESAALRTELDRANALLLSEPQFVADWPAASDEPSIGGDPSIVGVAAPHHVLAFGSWLEPGKARVLERAVDALRALGEPFAMSFITLGGRPIEGAPSPAARSCGSRMRPASSANSWSLARGTRRC